MPTFGNPNGGEQGNFAGAQPVVPTLEDVTAWLLPKLEAIEQHNRNIENWIAGPGAPVMGSIQAAAALADGTGVAAPIGVTVGAAAALAQLGSYTHVGSTLVDWFGDQIRGYDDLPPLQRFSISPSGRVAAAAGDYGIAGILEDTGVIRGQTTSLIEAPPDMTEDQLNAIAETVWFYDLGVEAWPITYLADVQHRSAAWDSLDGVGFAGNPYFRLHTLADDNRSRYPGNWRYGTITAPPLPDFSALLVNDTVLTFLQRTMPAYTWSLTPPNGLTGTSGNAWALVKNVAGDVEYVRCVLTDRDLVGLVPLPVPEPAGVWPGLANVTLGSPVEFTGMAHLAGPMDGVLVDIDAVPPSQAQYETPSGVRYYQVGWGAFQTDNGDFEAIQLIDFPNAILAPKLVATSSGFDIWTKPTTHGTVTPWTRIA